jgi:hypothetical protein
LSVLQELLQTDLLYCLFNFLATRVFNSFLISLNNRFCLSGWARMHSLLPLRRWVMRLRILNPRSRESPQKPTTCLVEAQGSVVDCILHKCKRGGETKHCPAALLK